MKNDKKLSGNSLLREARLGRGWSQQALADLVGTIPNIISRWENGTTFPSPYFRQRLCVVFGKTPAELGLVPPALQASGVWNVPVVRSPYFVGREALLALLHERLSTARTAALTQPQALYGLGGIGKTQAAAEYAFRYRDEYANVFWMRAATRETLVADFVTLAGLLDLPEKEEPDQPRVVAAVKRWLAAHEGWLLILDNADDLPLAQEFLPGSHKGYVLFTTRAQAAGALAASVEVEQLSSQEGVLLLLHWTKLLDRESSLDQAREEDRATAEIIVREMGGLPLAIVQAGAYVEETRCSLADYLRLYATHRADLLARHSRLLLDYPETVATTWSLSFQQIEQQSPAAADLLRLCAFLAPDAIPEELLTRSAAELGAGLDPLWEPMAADESILNTAIAVLSKFSFIRRVSRTRTLNINRLVQIVLKESMDEETQRIWATRAVRAVNAAFPELESTSKEDSQHFISQAQMCADLITQYHLTFFEAVDLLDRAGLYFYNQDQYAQGDVFLKQAFAIREHLQDPDRIELFVSYSHKDEHLLYELVRHLSLLKQQGLISTWHICNIDVDPNGSNTIKQYLNFSQIILFLISSDFLNSDYSKSEEVRSSHRKT